LLNSLLQFDPDVRPDAVQTLRHPWLAVLHTNGEGSEPDCPRKFERWKEVEALETLEDYRSAIWNEIQQFRREVRGILPSSRRSSLVTDEPAEKVKEPSTATTSPESEELVQAMGDLDLGEETHKVEVGELPTEPHTSHRLAPLPESGQAEVFEGEAQQGQDHSRIRKDSIIGGRLLRSLSTISVHEVTGGDSQQLYSKAAVGQYILQKSAADAPPSERPKEFT
jgi:hypothetical protein